MFDVDERERIRGRLLELARADPAIVGAAITGSAAVGTADRWSDIDLAFAVDGDLGTALNHWTERLYEEFAAQHHWDLPLSSTIYRVFLLPGWLEADVAFTPANEFGPFGPAWRTVFGEIAHREPAARPNHDRLAGLAWHHALHAYVSIQRRRSWQAEHWISAIRDQVITLACLRLGHPVDHTKGAHLLPQELTRPLEATLVRSLDEAELWRALEAALTSLGGELNRTDPALAARLQPLLADITRPAEITSPTVAERGAPS